jgi:hypothetical protein
MEGLAAACPSLSNLTEIAMSKMEKCCGGHAGALSVPITQRQHTGAGRIPMPVVICPGDEVCRYCAAWFLLPGPWKVVLDDDAGSGPSSFAAHLLWALFSGATEIYVGLGTGLPKTEPNERVLVVQTASLSAWRDFALSFGDNDLGCSKGNA